MSGYSRWCPRSFQGEEVGAFSRNGRGLVPLEESKANPWESRDMVGVGEFPLGPGLKDTPPPPPTHTRVASPAWNCC